MNLTDEIRQKEESLCALMSRMLKGPLDPLDKSIKDAVETLRDTNDKLGEIDSSVKAGGYEQEERLKSLKRSLTKLEEQVLPDQSRDLQQLQTLLGVMSTKMKEPIELHRQSIDDLKVIIADNRDIVMDKLIANEELIQKSIISTQVLVEKLQEKIEQIENSLGTEQRNSQENHQALLVQFGNFSNGLGTIQNSLTNLTTENEINGKFLEPLDNRLNTLSGQLADVRKSNTSAVEENQLVLTSLLIEQDARITRHIASVQKQLKTLMVMAGIFFVSTGCYVALELWSKFN